VIEGAEGFLADFFSNPTGGPMVGKSVSRYTIPTKPENSPHVLHGGTSGWNFEHAAFCSREVSS
jgi:hypothetical protein